MYSCKPVGYIIFRKHYLSNLFEIVRLIILNPEKLRSRKASKCYIRCIFCKLILSNLIIKIITFLSCSSIIPKNCRSYYIIILIKNNKTVHLTSEAYSCNLVLIYILYKLFDSLTGLIIPVCRILL